MRKIDELLEEFDESHQNQINKIIHGICVPLIFFSLVGLISSLPAGIVQEFLGEDNPYANWAVVLIVFVLVYYVTLSIPIGFGMMLFAALCLYLARIINQSEVAPLWLISISIFALAWLAQYFGHKVEGKQPSLFKQIWSLLIGPAWLMHIVYRKLRIPL